MRTTAYPCPGNTRQVSARLKVVFLWCPAGGAIQQRHRDMQYVQMMKSKWRLKVGMKHNSTRQKHFRMQVIF